MSDNGKESSPLKVAIVGAAPIGRDAIPWEDESWEIWGLNAHHLFNDGVGLPLYRRWDRWIQIHPSELMEFLNGPFHIQWLKESPPDKHIYMQGTNVDYPASEEYPLMQIIRRYGIKGDSCGHCALLTCSVAQAMALALYLGADEVGLYGVTGDEPYAWQKEGVLFWLGMTHALTTLTIPADHPWMKAPIYGYEVNKSPEDVVLHVREMHDELSRRRAPIEQEHGRESAEFRELQAQINLLAYIETLVIDPVMNPLMGK